MAKEEYSVGIDVGSHTVRVVVARFDETEGKPKIVGVGKTPSAGIRRGMVVDIEEAVSSISTALEQAERTSGFPIERALIAVGGSHLASQPSKGVIAVSRADSEIGEDDIARAIDAAAAVSVPPNSEILHVIPKDYIVDSQEGIKDPIGMTGIRLEVDTVIIEGSVNYMKNLTKCVYRAGINTEDLVVGPLAAANSVLTKRQKELGVVMVDIGAGTTSIIVFEESDLMHISVLPIGSAHITNDLAIGLRTSIDVAEKVKLEYGTASTKDVTAKDDIDLSQIAKGEEGVVSRKQVADIIEARLQEIFTMVDQELINIDRSGMLPAGSVLVGGGVKLPGVVDIAKDALRLPAQIGFPQNVDSPVEATDDPAFAVATGLVTWEGAIPSQSKQGFQTASAMSDTVSKIKEFITNLFP
ncbi:MAG: cell division protein FtsA [bacterium]